MPKKLTRDEFIKRAQELLKDVDYDYSLVDYKNATTPIKIKCNTHNYIFEQKPMHTLKGNNGQMGCKYCNKNGLNNEDYIYLAKLVHHDNFNYSKTSYKKMADKIIVICNLHNLELEQNAQRHLLGANPCPECNGQKPITKLEFIRRAVEKHGHGKFGYSMIPDNFNGVHSMGSILCLKHGIIFTIDMWSHINAGANGCPLCNKNSPYDLYKLQNNADKTYGNNINFDYSKVDFSKGCKEKVLIGCTIHNTFFEQTLDLHVSVRNGCSQCTLNGVSKKEIALGDFIKSLGFDIVRNKRNIIPEVGEIDIFIPQLNIAFEFNGLYFHQEKFRSPNYHHNKTMLCKENNIRLLHIWEDDWDYKNCIVKEHIKHVLNVSNRQKLYARNTIIKIVNKTDANNFYNAYHIQGAVNATVHIGLFKNSNDTIPVALMSFIKNKDNYTLSRYATSSNVVGGHSKLLKYFENNYSYNKLVTFADLSFSYGGLYERTKWVMDGIVPPDYSYIINNKRVHKFNFRKDRFKKDSTLLFEDNMTEAQLAELNSLPRVWDAGKIRYVRYGK